MGTVESGRVILSKLIFSKLINYSNFTKLSIVLQSVCVKNITKIVCEIENVFLGIDALPSQVSDIVLDSYLTVDDIFTESDAIRWADEFEFSQEDLNRDVTILHTQYQGNLLRMVEDQHQLSLTHRLNGNRINEWDPTAEDEDLNILRSLVNGIPVTVDETFIPNGKPRAVTARYQPLARVVDKLMIELVRSRMAFLIPTQYLQENTDRLNMDLHYTPWGWTAKKGKASGRPTNNYSYKDHNGSILNSKFVKGKVELAYGPIVLSTLEDAMRMILTQSDRIGWSSLALWKKDLKGAFNLMSILPAHVGRLATQLSNGMTMISLVGNFGSTILPFAFNVLSRAIIRRINDHILGGSVMFVDDMFGACSVDELNSDMNTVDNICREIAGPDAIATSKDDSGRKIDFIGWAIDLDTRIVSIAEHNFRKTLYGFFIVDIERPVTVLILEKLASWASRYCLVCRYMKPFTGQLYLAFKGFTNKNTLVTLKPETIVIIELWRIFLCLHKLDPHKFSRTIESFRLRPPSVFLCTDASLTGIGLVIRHLLPDGSIGNYIAVVGLNAPFDLNKDSSYQNSMEFLAIVAGLLVLQKLGYTEHSIHCEGDNETALRWSKKENFKVGRSMAGALAFIKLGMVTLNDIASCVHIPGVTNVLCDKLSRGVTPRALGYNPNLTHDHLHTKLEKLLDLCNPSLPVTELISIQQLWCTLDALLLE